ncbi:MAG: ATP-binding protein, partial [Candidatus Latescibacteria bacterium]|nr:ATP-binding protein [Candidatus Latescibacterota bacterium]
MTQAGGPAAINGFLYQILHHIEWVADVSLKEADQEVENALLVLEPRNGGDARMEASDQYLVEQYKTRANAPWSLTDMETILRDLRKAVPSSLPANAQYRFVTDGRAGRLGEFKAFLDALKLVEGPDHLNNDEKRKLRNEFTVTDREFFDHIVKKTRSSAPQQHANERAVVFHLLSHFEMEFCVTSSGLIEKIEKILFSYVANLHDERGVRERLVGLLMERLSKGEIRLNSTDLGSLLREAGLSIERLRNLNRLPETMAELNQARLDSIGYQHEKDVREVPCWPEGKPVLLITGESGAGKTWQLGKYLEECVEMRRTATLIEVHGAKTTKDILTQAARNIWQEGLGETSDQSLIAISNFLPKINPDIPIPLLTVVVDGIQNVDVARDLIRQNWMKWGMRLILTVPNTVAHALKHTDKETIYVHPVNEFSIDELDALLKQHGQRWADLPSDLKKLLCKPILAGLYLELSYTSFLDAPCSEYEIFEKFWEKMVAKCQLGDAGIVTALATHTYEGNSYPLLRKEWQEIGLDDERLARLQAAGWLRSLEDGEVEFVHDRLLNWAVAKYLARKFQRKELSIDELCDTLVAEIHGHEERLFQRLGYVPMDTFWLLADGDTYSKTLGKLVAKMDNRISEGYIHLLPTLGQRSVPILLELLNRITSDSDCDYKVSLIRKALVNLAQQEEIKLEEITALLNKPDPIQQSVAIAVFEAAPDPRHLDRLWDLHQQCADARDNNTDGYNRADYQASFAALRAGIELDPEWLRNRILAADKNGERIVELGYLLSGLEHPDAPALWQDTSDVLMSRLSPNKPRSLINCIARFEDHEKINFVIERLSRSEDSASGAAIRALTILAPQDAIGRLIEVEERDLSSIRNEWLPHLLRVHPEQTRQRILELAQSDSRGYWLITSIFWERPNELNEAMLRFVLRTLETDLRDIREAFTEESSIPNHPLDFLGRIACPKLLKILQAEADGELERLIVEVAFSRLHMNGGDFDYVLENARRILILIEGQGITDLINRELASEHFWVRHGGLKWAFVRADDSTIKQLAAIARRPIPLDANGKLESESFQDFCQSLTVLAVLGDVSVLVKILMQTDVVNIPSNLVDHLATLRAHRGPMPKVLTQQALRIIQDEASPEALLKTSLLIACLSGNADFIPTVRTVLEQADPDSQIAKYACIALRELGDQSDDFARLAEQLTQTRVNVEWGLNALIGLGNKGIEFLQNWIRSPSTTEYIDSVIRILYRYAETRKFAVDAAVHRCLNSRFTLHPLYDIAAESD